MIKFVYFDLGGTLINDFSGTNKWEIHKRELGITPVKDTEFDQFWTEYEHNLCAGKDTTPFIQLMNKQFNINIPSYESLLTGFINKFTENRSIWPIIREVKQKTRIGMLTNMYPGMFDAIKKRQILPEFNWEIIIDSSVVGFQKPEKEIYQIAQAGAKVKNQEIFFIDNTPQNLQTAQLLGWQTFLYDSNNSDKSSKELYERLRLN